MLFKKTLKVAVASTLWIAALVGSTSAMADLHYTGQAALANKPVTFAKQSFLPSHNINATAPTKPKFYSIDLEQGTDGSLRTLLRLGLYHLAIDESLNLYLRFDFNEHVVQRALPAGAALNVIDVDSDGNESNTPNCNVQAESSATDAALILQVGSSPDTDCAVNSNSLVVVDFADSLAASLRGNGSVRVRGYQRPFDAVAETGHLFEHNLTLFKVADGLTFMARPMNATAEVESEFKQFTGNPLGGTTMLGYYELSVTPSLRGRTGATIPANTTATFAETLTSLGIDGTKSTASVKGDGGFAFAKSTSLCPPASSVADAVPLKPGATDTALAGPLSATLPDDVTAPLTSGGKWNLCFNMVEGNSVVIPEGEYKLDLNFAKVATGAPAMAVPNVMDKSLGMIEHNGTTVHIPYLTSFENYAQRIVIRSRNKVDVAFTLAFQPGMTPDGSDGTVTPASYDGLLEGEKTTTIRVADVADFMGPTRGSATLTIVSSPAKIDVAVTMVNMMDQATDTVVYHRGLHEGSM